MLVRAGDLALFGDERAGGPVLLVLVAAGVVLGDVDAHFWERRWGLGFKLAKLLGGKNSFVGSLAEVLLQLLELMVLS